jgi:Glycosidases
MSVHANWMADQVVYQIFPDRFAIGHPYDSQSKLSQPAYRAASHHGGTVEDYVARGWNEAPVEPGMGKDFFGGDLGGIGDHLGHLTSLGVTALFLNPIFFSPSNHKYDALDHFLVDPQFGGDGALCDLIEKSKAQGLRLILDAVLNHVSDIHPWFIKAKEGCASERDFFTFAGEGYMCWRGWNQLPELRHDSAALRDLLFEAPSSVLQKYLAMGISGWRFDAANDLGLSLVARIRAAVSARYPDAALIGEVTNYAADWVHGGHFHGVMNYYFRAAMFDWLKAEISAQQLALLIKEYVAAYGHDGVCNSWNILSSHDTARLRHALPEAWKRKLALIAQFTVPGVPLIYYGEEIGMDGGEDPNCRRPMIWDQSRWDQQTLALYKRLIAIRKERAELRSGLFKPLSDRIEGNALVYLRYTAVPQELSLIVLNASKKRLSQHVLIPHAHLYDGVWLQDLLAPDAVRLTVNAGGVTLDLPPHSAAILVPRDDQYSNYHFFKC